ncbi:RNA polymerase II elongation factor Ell isoform X2 [Plodia interpunctella]|uniref:RNA polymerase II elongation factor Ell isoform X2 n=1 Tax=Plodia interpunctella TaxID=58824 RepID=UPI00236833EC|nr:RNA polymerase II elongation factor Ell isoform X2 [Plodia interpunctella]
MAALPAGVQYGLSSESTYKENKELVFVKLTDSALKAIEDFIKNNKGKLGKPTIQFLPGNEGKISIPASNGNGPSGETTFHFSVNSNAEMEGPQGSFECVRGGGPRRLESCGPLPRRMRVQANDDSYEATKDRMARTVAAEQSKCTRVIKPNQTDIGRRVKVRSALYSTGPAPHAEPRDRPERIDRPERSERVDRERIDRLERPERAAAPPAPRPQPQLPQLQPQLQPQQQPHPLQHLQQRQPPSNPDLTKRSIKERVIQLLALKPYKKPELYARLNSEGIKERERGLVSKILPQISTLKDNCYHLRRHIWNDVNEDWPFYTEEEKRTLKRRKPQNLTPPLSSDSAHSLSPRASPGGKRAAAGADELPAKKQRISHYRRPSPPSSGYATTSSGERHASDNEDDRTTVKKDNGYTLNFTTVKEICASPVKANGFRNSPPVEQTNITVKDITNTEPLENTELTSAPDDKMTELDDIERRYPPITSSSTRRAYKNEFATLYKEYRALYERVAQVAALFTRLEQQLRRAQPHSPDQQNIEQRIQDEYRRISNDNAYQQQRRRVDFLTRKLNHIKQMVQQYDNLRTLKPSRVSPARTTQAY